MKTVRQWVVGVLAMLWVCVGMPVSAQVLDGAPRIDGFDVEEVAQLSTGTALHFTIYGTPGASARLNIDGAQHAISLPEVQAGMYEGGYTIEPLDRITPDSRVVAELLVGDRVASAVLEEPLMLGAVLAGRCDECGVVQAIRSVPLRGEPGVLGAVAGGVIGAILGNQVGRGDGRSVARILGAIGGAYAGREIERARRQRVGYDVVVRMDGGEVQTRRLDAPPPFRVGDRVRLAQGRVLRESELDPR